MWFQLLCLLFLCLLGIGTAIKKKKQSDPVVRESFFNSTAFHDKVTEVYQINKNADLYCKVTYGRFYFYASTNDCTKCSDLCIDPPEEMKYKCLDKCNDFMINYEWEQKYFALASEFKDFREDVNKIVAVVVAVWIVISTVAVLAVGLAVGQYLYNKRTYSKRPPNNKIPDGDKNTYEDMSTSGSYTSVPPSDA